MIFHDNSEYVKNWMNEQFHVKEESLTDWILFDISKRTSRFYYKAFSKHEESKNGADWEWWIITRNCSKNTYNAYRFFIQAKKITPVGDNYPRLNYSNTNGNQIDLLLSHAETYNAFPFYMFYSTSEPEIEEQKKNISYIEQSALEWCSTCNNGCFLSVAYDIYNLLYGKARTEITDICLLNHSFKFSILDLLLHMADYECDKLLSDFNNNVVLNSNKHDNYQYHDSFGNKHFGERIPSYLALFLERHNENLSWFESEMRKEIPTVGGIAVLDLRN